MKQIYEKLLSIAVNRLCLIVAVFAMLPFMIGWLAFSYWLFQLFKAEGVVMDSIVWNAMGIGFMCLMIVLIFLFTSVMEGVDKELKKMYWDMKDQRKKFKEGKNIE